MGINGHNGHNGHNIFLDTTNMLCPFIYLPVFNLSVDKIKKLLFLLVYFIFHTFNDSIHFISRYFLIAFRKRTERTMC